jgi:hypothetical protein
MQPPEQIPAQIRRLRLHCLGLYRCWWTTHYLVGVLGVLAGGLAAAGQAAGIDNVKKWTWLFGSVAALATSLVTFLGPLQRAQRYWEAFHLIDQTCLEYEHSIIDLSALMHGTKQTRALLLGAPGRETAEKGAGPEAPACSFNETSETPSQAGSRPRT